MAHAFHAIGNTANGETLLGVFHITDDVSTSYAEAYHDAEECCEAHRRQKATAFKPYAYVKEVGYDDDEETPEERQERATAEQARIAELIADDPFRDVLTALVEWQDYMGGFDAKPWKDAKRLLKKERDAELKAMGRECAAEYLRRFP
jgi:hypothetical protein